MKQISPPKINTDPIYEGSCSTCQAEYQAHESELQVETCPREHYQFAHHKCPEPKCGGNIIFYKKLDQRS